MEMSDKIGLRSCISDNDSQDYLIECLKNNDIREIQTLLEEERVNINHFYDYPYYKTPLSIACQWFSDSVTSATLKLLLTHEAEPLLSDDDDKNALHYAAESCNENLLKTILDDLKNNNFDFENSNVLLSLIKQVKLDIEYGEKQREENDFIKNIELLIEYGIDVNKCDESSGESAIYMAANYGFKKIISVLLKHGPINLEKYRNKRTKKTARDLIEENKLYEGTLPDICDENENISIETIFKNLRDKNFTEFETNFEKIEKISIENKNKLLHMAVEKGLDVFVRFLLEKKADHNSIKNTSLLAKAVDRGYYKIVKILHRESTQTVLANSLIVLMKVKDFSKTTDIVDYNQCLDILLRNKELKINYRDIISGKTPAHLAAIYQEPEILLKLLKKGASLASTDIFGHLPLVDMDADTLKTHLDDCIEENQYFSNDDIHKNITIRVTSLLPPRQNTEIADNEDNCKLELDSEPLLSSPEVLQETTVFQYLSNSKELKHLLKHPVLMTLIFLKWYHIRKLFYLNLTTYLAFFVSLLTYIMFGYNKITETDYPTVVQISLAVLVFTYVILILREIGQMIIYRFRYLMIFENWLEIALLVITFLILSGTTSESTVRQLSAVAVVLSAIELLLLIGHIPCLSTNIIMLRTVSFTFFKLLLWYSILLLAFAFSFYTLFQEKASQKTAAKNATNEDDEEQDFFEDPGMSLLKTIVMLTGEFDAGSIKFNSYPIISHLIFVLFVFLITIVLFNLLNGLAVSDTQLIKNDAELYYQILRVEHIAHIEKVLLRNKPLLKWFPIVKTICLFPLNTSKMEIKIFQNQNYKIVYGSDNMDDNSMQQTKCFTCEGMNLGRKIQRAIKNQLQEKHAEEAVRKRDEFLLGQIKSLREQINQLQDLIANKK